MSFFFLPIFSPFDLRSVIKTVLADKQAPQRLLPKHEGLGSEIPNKCSVRKNKFFIFDRRCETCSQIENHRPERILDGFPLYRPAFYEPPSDIISSQVCTSFKEQIAFFSTNTDLVAISLTTSAHCCCLGDLQNFIDLICDAVFPNDFSRKHYTVFTEIDFNLHIYFCSVLPLSGLS